MKKSRTYLPSFFQAFSMIFKVRVFGEREEVMILPRRVLQKPWIKKREKDEKGDGGRVLSYSASLLLIVGAIVFSLFMIVEPVSAAGIIPTECIDSPTQRGDKPPGLNCVLLTFESVAKIILGVTGSFALLMFVYGGFEMLRSAGNQEGVTRGKTILRNAVIGIFIIFGSGYLITYGVAQLRGGGGGSSGPKLENASEEGQCEEIKPGYTCRVGRADETCYRNLCLGQAYNIRCCPGS